MLLVAPISPNASMAMTARCSSGNLAVYSSASISPSIPIDGHHPAQTDAPALLEISPEVAANLNREGKQVDASSQQNDHNQ